MPPSESIVHRLELIERELAKAHSEFPADSAMDRLKFVRAMVRLVRSQIELDDDETVPVLDVELRPSKDYRQG
jgi:hypothetical protein